MKNHILIIFTTLFLFLTYSCSKETVEPKADSRINKASSVKLPFPESNFTYKDIVVNEEDKEDEAINKKLYSLTKYLAEEIINIETARKLVATSAKQGGEISFNTIFEQNLKMKNLLKEKSFFASKTNPYIYKGTKYQSYLTIPNYEKVNDFNSYILAVGADVEDDEINNNPDIIHGWAVNKEGIIGEVKVGEKDAMASNVPVIVVTQTTLGEKEVKNLTNTFNKKKKLTNYDNKKTASIDYFFDKLRIEHRFERSKQSEVFVHSFKISESGLTQSYVNFGFDFQKGKLLKEVHKDDIGELLDIHVHLYDPGSTADTDVVPLNSNAGFLTVYERDWYSNRKPLGQGCFNGTTMSFSCKRKFANEWYSYDPDETDPGCNYQNNATIQESIYYFEVPNKTFNFEDSRGELRLRFQP